MNNRVVKEVIILGSPRSGTSLTASILNFIGIDMGEARKPDFENPHGYFEDISFSKLMGELFKLVSPEFDGFHPPSDDQIKSVFPKLKNDFSALIEERRERASKYGWGWKVPSTVFVMEYLLPMLTSPHFVIVVRNPLDIANSMMEYTKNKNIYKPLSLLEALKVTNYYYAKVFSFISNHNECSWTVISYESLLKSPVDEIEKLVEFLDIEVSKRRLKRAAKIVDPNIKIRKKVELILTKLKWKLEGAKKRL